MTIYKKSLDYFGVDNSLRDELDSNWLNIKKYLLSNDFTERWIINKILRLQTQSASVGMPIVFDYLTPLPSLSKATLSAAK